MTRRRLLTILVPLVLVAIAGLAWFRLTRPRTDEDRVRVVHEDLIEAFVDGDFDDVWNLMSRNSRGIVQATRCSPEGLRDLFGLTRDEIGAMTAEEFFIAYHEHGAARHPAEWKQVCEQLADLEVIRIQLRPEQDAALVSCRGELLGRVREPVFGYVVEDGRWRALLPGRNVVMKFLTLESKLDVPLPGDTVDPASVELLLEIGPGDLDAAMITRLRDHLRSRGETPVRVLIDAAPDASWQSVVTVASAILTEGHPEPWFATTKSPGPPSGLRINGAPADASNVPALPRDHPALRRILGGGH